MFCVSGSRDVTPLLRAPRDVTMEVAREAALVSNIIVEIDIIRGVKFKKFMS